MNVTEGFLLNRKGKERKLWDIRACRPRVLSTISKKKIQEKLNKVITPWTNNHFIIWWILSSALKWLMKQMLTTAGTTSPNILPNRKKEGTEGKKPPRASYTDSYTYGRFLGPLLFIEFCK